MGQVRQYASGAERQAAYRKRVQEAQRTRMKERGLPALPAIPTMPGTARWQGGLTHALNYVQSVHTEMQDYYDCRSQAWQESEKGELFSDQLESLEALAEDLEESVRSLKGS